MTFQEIQNAQQLGSNYATDNYEYAYKQGMTAEEFASAVLENYNENSFAANEPTLPEEYEADFLFGAKTVFKD